MSDYLHTRAATFMILQDADGRLLLQQRKNTGYLDGHWDFAATGHVDADEGILDAAVRELREEIDVTARPEDLQLVHVHQNFLDTPYINFFFTVQNWQGTPRICEPHKCAALEYFAPDQLPQACTLGVRVWQQTQSDVSLFSVAHPDDYGRFMGVPYIED